MTQQELQSLLDYDPTTGLFTWRTRPSNRVQIGDVAGFRNASGYVQLRIKSVLHYAHRLVFLHMSGTLPTNQIDHINGVRYDNRWINLREASHTENMRNCARSKNNSSGVSGVIWERRRQKWRAAITVDRKDYFLGYFDDLGEATLARKQAEQLYGFHANHGRAA